MSYQILPYRFERIKENVFLSNEVGEYLYLTIDDFNKFIEHRLEPEEKAFKDLKSKQIIADSHLDNVSDMLATKYRRKKNFLTDFTSLHMIVASLRCNSNCSYCQVSKKDLSDVSFDMTKKTAKKVVEKIFESPSSNVKIEFQGGEPLLNFETIIILPISRTV